MIDSQDQEALRFVFGETSRGATAEARARTSPRYFVRSQVQLALATPSAKGRILSASEGLRVFGFAALFAAVRDGSFPFLRDHNEPAKTFRTQRTQLNLSIEQLAKAAGVTPQAAQSAETAGIKSSIRDLESLAQTLALDERVLGYLPDASADKALGVRLRELADANDHTHFTANSVLQLSEAAWVIARQMSLRDDLGYGDFSIGAEFDIQPDPNYSRPVYEQGFRLAHRTRQLLGLGETAPIESLRSLFEEKLQIPLIQQVLDERFAGATLANGPHRGIVVNESGRNHNVWVRRMTMAHELCHLLWDPDQRLNRLVVDEYDAIDGTDTSPTDPVEIRANAFAVSFLAPPKAVRELQSVYSNNRIRLVSELMNRFGISATAANRHFSNVTKSEFVNLPNSSLPTPSADWIGRENMSVDYFPIGSTPISRRGRFAFLVAKATEARLISKDTAAMYLKASIDQISDNNSTIINLLA